MKHDDWRLEPAAYPVTTEIVPRYADVDGWHHLNNVSVIGLHAEGVQRWLQGSFGSDWWRSPRPHLRNAVAATDFLAEGQYPDPLRVGARLLDAGRDGFRLATALFQRGRCIGLHEVEVGAWQEAAREPLPAAMQAVLQERLAAQPALPDGALATPGDLGDVPPPAPREAYPWHTEIQARYGDRDAHGTASDTGMARYAEHSRGAMMFGVRNSNRALAHVGFMVVHTRLRFLRHAEPPRQWTVGGAVTKLGRSSLTVRIALFDGDVGHAVCDTVLVVSDRQTRRPTRLPPELVEALAPLTLAAA